MRRIQKPIRVLLVDDEEIIRYGIQAILQCEPEIEVVGEATNGQEALAQVEELNPDIVLMDIHMPNMNGIVATEKIGQKYPDVKVLILTTSIEKAHVHDAFHSKAAGYMLKCVSPDDLIHTIQRAYEGEIEFGPIMGRELQQRQSGIEFQSLNQWQRSTPCEKDS